MNRSEEVSRGERAPTDMGEPDHGLGVCDICHYSEVPTWDIGELDEGAWERCWPCGGPLGETESVPA